MRELSELLKRIKDTGGSVIGKGGDGLSCQIPRVDGLSYDLCIIVSWGNDWDHVSIHAQALNGEQFTPFWQDMCYIKNLFFKHSETVVQYHPPSNVYINNHQHVLHLWRPQKTKIELPPIWMV